jgi:peptidoglycan/LPS O-acetylase OafA/YrhL
MQCGCRARAKKARMHTRLDNWFPSILTPSTRRYVTLDGMRGVAAMIVILFHAAGSIAPYGLRPRFGFLAVDLFFALSGFVLAYSYDRKFAAGMTPLSFMRLRFIRLYPLFALGLCVGLALRIIPAIQDATTTGGAMTGHEVAISAFFNAFMLPAPDGVKNHFLFPADLQAWSLFFEVWVANLAFALFWRILQGRRLAIFIAAMVFSILMCEIAFHTLDVGAQWKDVAGGFVRVALMFFIGVAIARVHASRPPRLRIPSWSVLIIVAITMFMPLSGVLEHLYELVCALIIFPALIYWGAAATERRPAIGSALGDASYAAYAIHIPLLGLIAYLAPSATAKPSELYGLAFVAVTFCLSLLLARFYDKPIRELAERAFCAQRQRRSVTRQA